MADGYLLSEKRSASIIWVGEGKVGKVVCCTKEVMGRGKKLIRRISTENIRRMEKM
jgi:hypothetical protein